ncbi:hypothetical protein [Bacillus sp. NPDC094106]
MFNQKSGLVGIWTDMVKDGRYKREQVPKLSNLREEVYKKLDESTAE